MFDSLGSAVETDAHCFRQSPWLHSGAWQSSVLVRIRWRNRVQAYVRGYSRDQARCFLSTIDVGHSDRAGATAVLPTVEINFAARISFCQ